VLNSEYGTCTLIVHNGVQVIAEYDMPVFICTILGSPALPGSFSTANNGTITLVAVGTDIWGTSDEGRYAYGMLSDGTLFRSKGHAY
jgi:hypothetical protein